MASSLPRAANLLKLIDAYRDEILPPHGMPRATDNSLERAYRTRQRVQIPRSGVERTDRVFLAFVTASGIGVGWLFRELWPIGLAAFFATVGGCWTYERKGAWKAAPSNGRQWAAAYRAAYVALATTPLALAITDYEHVQLVHSTERAALDLSRIGNSKDVHEAMLRLARSPELFRAYAPDATLSTELFDQPLSWRLDTLSLLERARYAAIYDHFYQPHEAFLRALHGERRPQQP